MDSPAHPLVHVLSIHADYRCGDSGACCTSGWPIAIEDDRARLVGAALEDGRLGCRTGAAQRSELLCRDGLLPNDAAGRCLFFDGSRARHCAIQAALGHEALPLACRQFPRVTLRDDRGVFVTLSHYCPTAAASLFDERVGLRIVTGSPAFPAGGEFVGLDARGALPPLLRPRMLADLDGYAAWEHALVLTLDEEGRSPEDAVSVIRNFTEDVRAWRPGDGPLRERLTRAVDGAAATPRAGPRSFAARLQSHALVAASIPASVSGAPPLPDPQALERAWSAFAEPALRGFSAPLRRYLAARAFGCWLAYQGQGLRTIVESLVAALDLVHLEAARLALAASRPVDAPMLLEAIRAADLLLVHLVSPQSLAERFARIER